MAMLHHGNLLPERMEWDHVGGNLMPCPVCKEPVIIMLGPEEYHYDHTTKKIYHARCWFEHENRGNMIRIGPWTYKVCQTTEQEDGGILVEMMPVTDEEG